MQGGKCDFHWCYQKKNVKQNLKILLHSLEPNKRMEYYNIYILEVMWDNIN